jgi:UDP-glucuronate 4-epimerase
MKILVTGSAGFIGMHICQELLALGHTVIGIDNLNDYYDVHLKQSRLDLLSGSERFKNINLDIADFESVRASIIDSQPSHVIHLAAQAGVRYSLQNPHVYTQSNLLGFANILELVRELGVKKFIFASSSSVYGANKKVPFCEDDGSDYPISYYAATKKANEVMAYSYSHLYKIPIVGLRFFTVYGPWGRPDMSPMIFTKAIIEGAPIKVFNHGKMWRDFTYIDDVVKALVLCLEQDPVSLANFDKKHINLEASDPPYQIMNVGNDAPVNLETYISILEDIIGKQAIKHYEELQKGDVLSTSADLSRIRNFVGFKPQTDLKVGLEKMVNWYMDYYSKP